jgi:hypothetical protein
MRGVQDTSPEASPLAESETKAAGAGSTPQPKPESQSTSGATGPQQLELAQVTAAWDQVLQIVRQRNPTTQAALNTGCEPVEVADNQIVVTFPFPFLREKLRDSQRLMEIQDAIGEVFHARCRVKFVLASEYTPKKGHRPAKTADTEPHIVEEPGPEREEKPQARGPVLCDDDLDQIKNWAEKHGGETTVINVQ